MAYLRDFNSSPELKHPFLEVFCIGFMALAWGVFILSTKNYQHTAWYPWLYYSRTGMAILGILLVTFIAFKKIYNQNIAAKYLLLSVGIQASHGLLEGKESIDFYNFIGIVFVLSCISFNGSLKDWMYKYLPFNIIFFLTPLFFKDAKYMTSAGTFIDSFSLMVSGLIIGGAILKITSSRYQFVIKYLESKNEIVNLAYQVAHDIRSPVMALRVGLQDVKCDKEESELIEFSLNRIEEISENLLKSYKTGKYNNSNSFVKDLELLVNEKKTTHSSIKFEINHDPSLSQYRFLHSRSDMNRVISNLLSNAAESINHTSGQVKIDVSIKNGVSLSIIDNGKGIPPEVLKNFQDKAYSYNKSSGNGLGLNHAKSFLQELGGQLLIQSEPNHGTIVNLQFPEISFQAIQV